MPDRRGEAGRAAACGCTLWLWKQQRFLSEHTQDNDGGNMTAAMHNHTTTIYAFRSSMNGGALYRCGVCFASVCGFCLSRSPAAGLRILRRAAADLLLTALASSSTTRQETRQLLDRILDSYLTQLLDSYSTGYNYSSTHDTARDLLRQRTVLDRTSTEPH